MIQDTIRIIKFLILVLMFNSCVPSESELIGTYVSENFKLNIDTLKIYSSGTYYHSIYDKEKRELIFRNNGEWIYRNGEMEFENFLTNLDELRYFNDSVNYDNTLMTYFVDVKKNLEKSK